MRAPPFRPAWSLAAFLLVLAFLFRGLLYLGILPPFEGWDEYQHLAYVAYVAEHDAAPVFGQSHVPLSLRPLLASLPQPESAREQTGAWGTANYTTYWKPSSHAPVSNPPPPIALYEAQHPPLYYWLMQPLWHAFGATHPLGAIYALRLVNLMVAAAGLAVFAFALSRMIPAFFPRLVVLGLACLHPLFLQNTARIANDSLAIAFAMAAIACLVMAARSAYWPWTIAATVFVGLSAWTKQTGLILIPVLLAGHVLNGRLQSKTPWQIVQAGAASLLVLVAILLPLWIFNERHYGSITVTQEALALKARGATWLDLISHLSRLQWSRFVGLFLPGFVWVGGWSSVPINHGLNHLYAKMTWLLWLVAGIGAVLRLRSAWRNRGNAGPGVPPRSFAPGTGILCGTLVAATAAGMLYHALLSHTLFGFLTTNPWYFMMALPFLFLLLMQGVHAVDHRLPVVFGLAFAALFIAVELHGLFVDLAPFYADTSNRHLLWTRLGSIHPPFPHPAQRWLFLSLEGASLAGALAVCLTPFHQELKIE